MIMQKFTIAVSQMNVRLNDIEANLKKVKIAIDKAVEKNAVLLVLPELWPTGFPLESTISSATPDDTGVIEQLAHLAVSNKIAIIGSSLIRRGRHITNTATFLNSHGKIILSYDKIHLFKPMNEHCYLNPGKSIKAVNSDFGRIGTAICYDLRFPEFFIALGKQGCHLIVIPAAWPKIRIEHWRILLRARAVENSTYVIGCNQTGKTADTVYGGCSVVVDPSGSIIAEATDQETLFFADIELEKTSFARQNIPVFVDRRPEIYKKGGINGP